MHIPNNINMHYQPFYFSFWYQIPCKFLYSIVLCICAIQLYIYPCHNCGADCGHWSNELEWLLNHLGELLIGWYLFFWLLLLIEKIVVDLPTKVYVEKPSPIPSCNPYYVFNTLYYPFLYHNSLPLFVSMSKTIEFVVAATTTQYYSQLTLSPHFSCSPFIAPCQQPKKLFSSLQQ